MTALSADQILTPDQYRPVRAQTRSHMMPIRAVRRVRVGDQLLLAFENTETLRYQVQEMITVENVDDPAGIAEEVAAYNRLLPGPRRLVATLFIENDDIRTVRSDLERLTGIQHQIIMNVGDSAITGVEVPGPDEDGPSTVTQAVHFLEFPLDDASAAAFCDLGVAVTLSVDHPRYRDSGPIQGASRAALVEDLSN